MCSVRLFLLQLSVLVLSASSCRAQNKDSLGWLEKVRISPPEIIVTAKLDTGADSSSLNASELREFERDGRKWVSFEVSDRNGIRTLIERPLLRTAMVKKRFGRPETRPVIRLGVCAGRRFMEADVNLVDRTNFESQMLLGRSFMAGNVTVDPAVTYTADPQCPKSSAH